MTRRQSLLLNTNMLKYALICTAVTSDYLPSLGNGRIWSLLWWSTTSADDDDDDVPSNCSSVSQVVNFLPPKSRFWKYFLCNLALACKETYSPGCEDCWTFSRVGWSCCWSSSCFCWWLRCHFFWWHHHHYHFQ